MIENNFDFRSFCAITGAVSTTFATTVVAKYKFPQIQDRLGFGQIGIFFYHGERKYRNLLKNVFI